MALAFGAPVQQGVLGDVKYQIRDITFDSSYPTAGEPMVSTDVGLMDIMAIVDLGPAGNVTPLTRRVTVVWDDVNNKLQAYSSVATGTEFEAEVANATNLSTVVQRVLIIGK